MAHFAELDKNNVVLRVIVFSNEALENKSFPDSEAHALAYLHQMYGEDTAWKQTSYNKNFRKNFAGIGHVYYSQEDVFMPPSPFPSWVADFTKGIWVPPIPKPDCKRYKWNEESKNWDYVPPPQSPFPSWKLGPCDIWQAPVPMPTDKLELGKAYAWQEDAQRWDTIDVPDPRLFPAKPTDKLPVGKRYFLDLGTKTWVVRDDPRYTANKT